MTLFSNHHLGYCRNIYSWPGNQMFTQLDKELRFGYQKNGSLVVAFNEKDREHLQELLKRGETNGVKNLRILEKDELFQMEPHVNPKAIAALYSPDAGNVIPYEFAIALAENAVDNGIELRIRRHVTAIEQTEKGFTVKVQHWEPEEYLKSKTKAKIPEMITNWLQIASCFVLLHFAGGLGKRERTSIHTGLIYDATTSTHGTNVCYASRCWFSGGLVATCGWQVPHCYGCSVARILAFDKVYRKQKSITEYTS